MRMKFNKMRKLLMKEDPAGDEAWNSILKSIKRRERRASKSAKIYILGAGAPRGTNTLRRMHVMCGAGRVLPSVSSSQYLSGPLLVLYGANKSFIRIAHSMIDM